MEVSLTQKDLFEVRTFATLCVEIEVIDDRQVSRYARPLINNPSDSLERLYTSHQITARFPDVQGLVINYPQILLRVRVRTAQHNYVYVCMCHRVQM